MGIYNKWQYVDLSVEDWSWDFLKQSGLNNEAI
jgi:hypothetical protein